MDKSTQSRVSQMPRGRRGRSRALRATVSIGILVLGLLLAAACGGKTPLPLPKPGGGESPSMANPTAPPPAPSAEQMPIQQAWEISRHADTFVEGENNDCAACHSPANWMPTDKSTFPNTCLMCKFEIKTPKPVVKDEWKSVQCESCHRVDKEGTVDGEIAAFNQMMAMFGSTPEEAWDPVANTTELCETCHRDTDEWHYKRDLGQSAHVGYACTKCHDAHSSQASCTAAGCHADTLDPAKAIAGHDAAHTAVNCVACHDAAGLEVGPVEGKDVWLTFREGGPGGTSDTVPYLSHNLQRKVECARCHFAGNPWGLKDGK